jgi:translocation and assembly module TamB
MSRRARLIRNIAAGIVAFLVLLVLGVVVLVHTAWFRNVLREKIAAAIQDSTGGRVEVGAFTFHLSTLEAVVGDLVIHGNEPAGARPFVAVKRAQVNIKLLPHLHHFLDISYFGVDEPEVNVIMAADGSTNIPTPRTPKPASNNTPLDTLVDLSVDRFELNNGGLTFNSARQPLNVNANNLRALLLFNYANQSYSGDLSMQPVYVVSGRNTPVVFTIRIPVTIGRNGFAIENAHISTPASDLAIRGSLSNPKDPFVTALLNGHLALEDVRKLANLPSPENGGPNQPSQIQFSAKASAGTRQVKVDSLRLSMGASEITAGGTLKSPESAGPLQFNARLDLGEVGRLAGLAARPSGVIAATGRVRLNEQNDYTLDGSVAGRELSVAQAKQRIGPLQFDTKIHADPQRIDANQIRLVGYGGELDGNFSLEQMAAFRLSGNLRNFDLQSLLSRVGRSAPYSGSISGPIEASGDLKAQGTKSITARARIDITPGRRGIPVSGKIYADYDGARDNLDVGKSYVSLPHTRLMLSGSLNNRLDLSLTSRDLRDLFAVTGRPNEAPVALEGGEAAFTGTLTGALKSPLISGHLDVSRFRVDGRHFDALKANVQAASTGASISNGILSRGDMQALFSAKTGLRDWKPTPKQPVAARMELRRGDLADLAALAGQPEGKYSGAASIEATVAGTVGNPTGSAELQVGKGTIAGEGVDSVKAQVQLSDQRITIPDASIVAGPARLNLRAEYQHQRDSLLSGKLNAAVQGRNVDLARLRRLEEVRPNTAGSVNLTADLSGSLKQEKVAGQSKSRFVLDAVNADAAATGLRFDNENYGDLQAKAWTAGQSVNYEVTSTFAGSRLNVNGRTQLITGYPTTADASLQNLPVERILTVARRPDIPVKGRLSGTAHFAGNMEQPEGIAELSLDNASLYGEKLDHLRTRIAYKPDRIEISDLEAADGPNRLNLSVRYQHPAGNLQSGSLDFRTSSTPLELARVQSLDKFRPGLSGTLRLNANGSASIRESAPRVLFRSLDADIAAKNLKLQGKKIGNATLKATTTGGRVRFTADSDLADAAIQARGEAQLGGDYPVNGQLTFKNVAWTHLSQFLGNGSGQPGNFDVVAEGQMTVNGPALKPDQLRAKLEVPLLRLGKIPRTGATDRPIEVKNQAPIVATLDQGTVRLQSFRLTGPHTEIIASGSAGLTKQQALDLALKANMDLSLLQGVKSGVFASGDAALTAAVRGTLQKPAVNGQLELRKASLNTIDMPLGISNANGTIVFSGTTATIRDLTAESGGGKVTLAGYVSREDKLRLGLRARAQNVRIRPQPGISVVASGILRLTGTSDASLASGNVNINGVTYAPQSDLGSLLTQTATPVQAPTAPSELLSNMRLDVRVRSSSSTTVQASLAQNLQFDTDLRLRGTAAQPAVLGRITITEGELVFFGSQYEVSSGTISFYNPVRIEPVLNVTLETQAKSVNVVLNVTGPIDNMKLSYTSDPPLQFQEIVALLAAGKTPTSDPTLLANQPSTPQQSFEQMGESAIVGKAIADPVASRLQRVFGVSQLKIDPTFTNGSDLPQARVTLQQQVATNLTFTYVTALDDPNTQIVRVEWAFNPRWSAAATRDENGIVSINFLYKRQFR